MFTIIIPSDHLIIPSDHLIIPSDHSSFVWHEQNISIIFIWKPPKTQTNYTFWNLSLLLEFFSIFSSSCIIETFTYLNAQQTIIHSCCFFFWGFSSYTCLYILAKIPPFVSLGLDSQFRKYPHSIVDSLGVRYDYASIMHYGKTAFSKNGKDTIVPKKFGVVSSSFKWSKNY